MNASVYLSDNFETSLVPMLRYKPAFALRTGIFSDLDRFLKKYPSETSEGLILPSSRGNTFSEKYLQSVSFSHPYRFINDPEEMGKHPYMMPGKLIENIPAEISRDTSMLHAPDFSRGPKCLVNGDKKNVFIHNEAIISDFVEINAEDGPVVIDKGTKVSSFSILKGPLYIGKNSVLDKVMISNSIAGNNCRLGGEISDSIIGDYTNKHHEGFLGHSLVGDWVNLGALTTTSDLKNNYGFIHLEFQDKKFATDSIKFGSIIGDCVKTGIGTLLNTGTVIDVGGLIFDGFPRQKYYPPFFWGGIPKQKYELGRFLSDMEIIMARRKCTPSEFIKETTKSIYENET